MRGTGAERRRTAALLALPLLALAGCATLPEPEAAAFHRIADTSRIVFNGITETEREALAGMAVRQVAASRGTLLAENCGPAGAGRCKLSYRFDEGSISLDQSAPKMRKLIADISDYGAAMADLAEAKDIAAAIDSASGAASAAATLAGLVGVPFAKPVLDAGVAALRGGLVAKRRRLMLETALAAQPVILAASQRMGKIAAPMRRNILAAAAIDLGDAGDTLDGSAGVAAKLDAEAEKLRAASGKPGAAEQLARIEARAAAVRAARAEQADVMIRAGNTVNAARGIDADFSCLATGHEKLVARLRDRKASLDEATADLDRFQMLVAGFADAADAGG